MEGAALAVRFQRAEQRERVAPGVDDGEGLAPRPGAHPPRDLAPRERLGGPLVLDPPQRPEPALRPRHDLARVHARELRNDLERGLRRRREHDGRAVMRGEAAQDIEDRSEVLARQRLRLVEDQHAVGEPVQFPHPPRPPREEALEQLHGRRDHDGRVPVLGGQLRPRPFARAGRVVGVAVVLQHGGRGVVRAPEDVAADPRGLLGDARERNGDDHAPLTVPHGVPEGERHAGARLAAAGGHGQAEEAGRLPGGGEAGAVDGAAGLVDRADPSLEAALVVLEAAPQPGDVRGAGFARAPPFRVEMRFRVEPVRVHETREQHPQQQIGFDPRARDVAGRREVRGRPEPVSQQVRRFPDRALQGFSAFGALIAECALHVRRPGQPAVVTVRHERERLAQQPARDHGAGRLVVRSAAAPRLAGLAADEVALPVAGELADVVPEAEQASGLRHAELARELRREVRGPLGVRGPPVPLAVPVRGMRPRSGHVASSLSDMRGGGQPPSLPSPSVPPSRLSPSPSARGPDGSASAAGGTA